MDVTSARRNGIAWHPDGGSLLAVPGLENDVSLFERLSWNVALTLKGPHSAAINQGSSRTQQVGLSKQHPVCKQLSLLVWQLKKRQGLSVPTSVYSCHSNTAVGAGNAAECLLHA